MVELNTLNKGQLEEVSGIMREPKKEYATKNDQPLKFHFCGLVIGILEVHHDAVYIYISINQLIIRGYPR